MQLRAQVLNRDRALFRLDERVQVRGLVMGPERWPLQWPERLPFPTLLRAPEQSPHKGQALPSGLGDRENRIIQKPEFRDQKPELSEEQ